MSPNRQQQALAQFKSLACAIHPELSTYPLPETLHDCWLNFSAFLRRPVQSLLQEVAQSSGLEIAQSLDADPSVLSLLQPSKARSYQALPLFRRDGAITIAIANPADHELIEMLRFASDGALQLVLALPEDISMGIQFAYQQSAAGAPAEAERVRNTIDASGISDEALVQLARELSRECVRQNASDMHIQPLLGGGLVRMRVDGTMRKLTLLPQAVYEALCRYLKVQSGMDPTNERTPQDGSLSIRPEGRKYDLRVSSLPTKEGERIVIRFLDQTRSVSLAQSGFALSELQAIRKLASHNSGLLLITGPTGSGKTTTLAGILKELHSVHRSIITVENPVEYTVAGISQVEVNDKAGLTFASALRSALRQDPDILLIGEIRDAETAEIALQAAMTGHLVLSTLHTNDAVGAVPRLLDLGCKPSVLADALLGVVAQRLYRKLCRSCREPVTEPLTPEEVAFQQATRITPTYRAKGCEACHYTGYQGRLPFCEVMAISPAQRLQILSGATPDSAPTESPNHLGSLSSSLARHIISGRTTPAEAMRVVGMHFWRDLAQEYATETPSFNVSLSLDEQSQRLGVLFLGSVEQDFAKLSEALAEGGFASHLCADAAAACELLKRDENIVLVIADIDPQWDDQQVCDWIRQTRVALSWSRLPALILYPAGRLLLEPLLRADGAIYPCIEKPLTDTILIEHIESILSHRRA